MISIIIPVFNEGKEIVQTINSIKLASLNKDKIEIIVVDGGSTDQTIALAKIAQVLVITSEKGRAKQMNSGASKAQGDILYFLHADSVLPANFDQTILKAVNNGSISGSFKLKFDIEHWFLKANSWFTRFNVNAVRFGDQSLFVNAQSFSKIGGFREYLIMMEDQEIIHRIKKTGKFVVMDDFITTSARKYVDNGVYKMQAIFYLIWSLYYLGVSQQKLLKLYKKLIHQHKL